MKLFNMGKNIKIKIFIRNMVGQMVKKSGRARFYLLCNHSCTLHFSGKKLLVKSKNFSLLKLWRIKIETKNKKDAKMVGFIKTCNQYTHKFNLVIFSALSVSSPPFSAGGYIFKKCCLEEMGNFLLLAGDDKNLRKCCLVP